MDPSLSQCDPIFTSPRGRWKSAGVSPILDAATTARSAAPDDERPHPRLRVQSPFEDHRTTMIPREARPGTRPKRSPLALGSKLPWFPLPPYGWDPMQLDVPQLVNGAIRLFLRE